MAKAKGSTVTFQPVFSPWRNVAVVLFVAMSAWPVTYLFNTACNRLLINGYSPLVLAAMSGGLLVFILTIIYLGCSKHIKDKYFYGFALFCFTSSLDVFVPLEVSGWVTGFLTVYLRTGEPYLRSAYGAAICLWDATGMLIMYIIMVFCISIRKSYRSVALYWSAGIINSLVVLLLSALCGQHGAHWGTALNAPYVIFPLVVGIYYLTHPSRLKTKKHRLRWYMRPVHALLVAYLLCAFLVQLIRALVVLKCQSWVTNWWGQQIEPVLQLTDPAPFIQIQVLVFLFYFLPVYVLSILALLYPGWTSFPDISLLHAGAAAQSQLAIIVTSLLPQSGAESSPPTEYPNSEIFWGVNLALLVGPQLLMLKGLFGNDWFRELTVETTAKNTNVGGVKHERPIKNTNDRKKNK